MYQSLLQSIIVVFGFQTDFDGEELRLWFHGSVFGQALVHTGKTPIGMTARLSLFHFLVLNCSYFESYHQSDLHNSIICLQDAVAVMKVPKRYMLTATHN